MSVGAIADLGTGSLLLALALSLYATLASAVAASRPGALLWRSAERARVAVVALLAGAVGLQIGILTTGAFQFVYVATNSSRELPPLYAVAALWSGEKGSLLLWTWGIALCASLATRHPVEPKLTRVAAALAGVVQTIFLALAIDSRPFALLPFAPSDGQGLNPSLQTPWMFLHPLPLYAGYAGFTVPFAYALAALITGQLHHGWHRTVRRWAVASWLALSVAMVFGAQWAAREKGWGGYWGWDPVENAALLPWLSGAAFLHSLMATERRGMLKIWTLALAGATFAFVPIGAFISRGGVVPSIHAFGASEGGAPFLYLALALVLLFPALLTLRSAELRSASPRSWLSRESMLGLTNLVLTLLALVVLAGTLAPWPVRVLTGREMALGPGFYTQVTAPLWTMLLVAMGVCPLVGFGAGISRKSLTALLWPAAWAGVGAVVGVGIGGGWQTAVAIALGGFVLAATLADFGRGLQARRRNGERNQARAFLQMVSRGKRHYGGYLVHAGVVVAGLGLAIEVPAQEMSIWGGLLVLSLGAAIALLPEARPGLSPPRPLGAARAAGIRPSASWVGGE